MPENNYQNWFNNDWITQSYLPYQWAHAWDSRDFNVLDYTLQPGLEQFTAWSQQMMSQLYQNWWNSAPEQMKRGLEAGVNPYLLANGVAGTGSTPSMTAPSSSNSGAAALGSLANMVGAASGGFGAVAAGVSALSKLRHEVRNIDADTEQKIQQLGFTGLQSKALAIQIKYMDYKEQMSCYQALANYNKTSQEYLNLKAAHENIVQELQKIIAETNLAVSETERNNAQVSLMNEQVNWQKQQNEFFQQHGYIAGSPFYEGLRDACVNGKSIDLEAFGDIVSSYEGKIEQAKEDVRAGASWDYRPSNPTEAVVYAGSHIGESLRNILFNSNGVTSWADLKRKIFSDSQARREFQSAYNDAKDDLYEIYLSRRRYYRNIRRGGNTQEVASAKMAMDNAKSDLDNFTIDKFGNELLSQTFKSAVAPSE